MKRLQAFFSHTVALLEEYPLPLYRYVFLFTAILAIRLCLEFFANQRLFRTDDVIHIGLWFLFIVQAFMIQLHFFSGVKTERIIRLVVCCFSIALTAPLIDLLVSQGRFSKMNYLSVNSVSDIVRSYFTIGGASLSRGATIGIRIEIVLLVVASFNYVHQKTKSLMRAFLATFSIYTVLFLSGALPFFLGLINNLFGIEYGPEDQSSMRLLFTLDILLFIVLAVRSGKALVAFDWSLVPLLKFIGSIGLVIFGGMLARSAYPANWVFDPTTLYDFPLLIIVLLLLTVSENHARRNVGQEDPGYFRLQNGLLFLLLLTSACISFYTFFAVLLAWALQFFLYEKPLRFILVPYLSLSLQACQSCAWLLIGFMTFRAPMIGIGAPLLLSVLLISFFIYLILFFIYRNTTTNT